MQCLVFKWCCLSVCTYICNGVCDHNEPSIASLRWHQLLLWRRHRGHCICISITFFTFRLAHIQWSKHTHAHTSLSFFTTRRCYSNSLQLNSTVNWIIIIDEKKKTKKISMSDAQTRYHIIIDWFIFVYDSFIHKWIQKKIFGANVVVIVVVVDDDVSHSHKIQIKSSTVSSLWTIYF